MHQPLGPYACTDVSSEAVAAPTVTCERLLTYRSAAGRWVLLATVLGSALAAVDSTVVAIALPAIGEDLDASFAGLQWTVTGYTLTLASLVLLSGAAGDRLGRRRVFLVGVVWFTLASLLCAAAPTIGLLIVARVLQGVGGALLTPASLSILQASFVEADRGPAIGTWAGFSGVAGALAPLIGGWLLGLGSWRWVFLVNLPLAALVVAISLRHMPESVDRGARGRVDWLGAALTVALLGAATYALIGQSWPAAGLAAAALVAFLGVERRVDDPLLPLDLFRIRQFSAVNAVTLVLYGPIAVFFFLLVVQLQVVTGWTALAAGTATIPVTAITLALSARSGAIAQRIGPRLQLTAGPLLCAAAMLLSLRIGPTATYVGDVLPAVAVLGLGLATLVAPLTATALSAAPAEHAGLASGLNNALARTAALLAIAAVPVAAGLTGDVFDDPAGFDQGFGTAMVVCAALFALGALLAAVAVEPPRLAAPTDHRPESEAP
ncbi:MFS transporter [Nocardioides sp. GY 10113]|uniref:MFS transporter n=1 Tax=Nocardioides sp. GY 10113 TaxID=2569761 RepID=UPI0010A7F3FB|nr:MFS transporter [Nocardioides sp. GY 10113]TIC87596.1 MFS transporter [Nocardioides sp. GY 10113]